MYSQFCNECVGLQHTSERQGKMAPVTRSKGTKPVNAPAVAPAAPTKGASGKVKKPKAPKLPAAGSTEITVSKQKVQKKKGSPKKKSKGKKTSPSVSAKPSAKASSKGSSRSSLKSPLKRVTKVPRSASPTDEPTQDDDFPELTQAYGIMPFLDQSRPSTPLFTGGQVLRPDESVLMTQLAHHVVNPPAWSDSRPGTGVRGFGSYLPRGFELAESPPPSASRPLSGYDGGSSSVDNLAYDRRRRDPRVKKRSGSIVRNASRPGREQPASFPRARRSTRRASGVVRDIVAQVEKQRPESPVSIKNAQVFKRPTVANVRRERGQLHDELRDWVLRLRRIRDEFDGVIQEVEDRMQIIKAVNRVQAPLRNAALGRGR